GFGSLACDRMSHRSIDCPSDCASTITLPPARFIECAESRLALDSIDPGNAALPPGVVYGATQPRRGSGGSLGSRERRRSTGSRRDHHVRRLLRGWTGPTVFIPGVVVGA